MPAPTYDLIEEKVLGSGAASVTFSSIPGTYKDLVLEVMAAANQDVGSIYIQFNGDTGSNYSITEAYGNGTNTYSYIASNQVSGSIMYYVIPSTTLGQSMGVANIMSYANSNVYKTVISRASRASSGTYVGAEMCVSLWRSTSAITSLYLYLGGAGSTFSANSVFRLWGVAG